MKPWEKVAWPVSFVVFLWLWMVFLQASIGSAEKVAWKPEAERAKARAKLCSELVRWDYIVPGTPIYCWLTERVGGKR